jgi:myo-inositol-1(or 4)-monophosphatase
LISPQEIVVRSVYWDAEDFLSVPHSCSIFFMSEVDLPRCLEVAQNAAREAGQVLLDWQGRFETREKSTNDFVTDADFAAQKAIKEILLGAFPGHGFLGEEDQNGPPIAEALQTDGPLWVVDPLDGTANYVHRLQTYAVSIALLSGGKPVVGVIYDPILKETFTAVRGQGAWLNGEAIRTSGCQDAAQAMLAVSFSNVLTRESPEISRFINILLATQSVRRLGSAALNLAYLATGRLDAYYASSVKVWDIAAGVLLVEEAGGIVTSMSGTPLNYAQPAFLAAASEKLHGQMLPWMQ